MSEHQPKAKPQTQEKSHGTAHFMKVTMKDTMKVFTGLNLCGAHCTLQQVAALYITAGLLLPVFCHLKGLGHEISAKSF